MPSYRINKAVLLPVINFHLQVATAVTNAITLTATTVLVKTSVNRYY